ncbi:MAG: transketolase [Spirochaetales bacterium]|nr:transketolase [Spirochaetales bacterium]
MNNPFNLSYEEIEEKAKSIRKNIIQMNSHAGAGHTGADLSESDILATLYFKILKFDPSNLKNTERDRFFLSKGHGAGGYYCTLAEAGIIDKSLLKEYLKKNSPLPGHPVRQKTPGVEFNTGALGHGFPVSVGSALAAKKTDREYTTYVLLGDGELEEGSNWEAAMSAAHFKLDNLIAIVDRNTLQLADRTEKIMALEPLADKFKAFGFHVIEADGNNPQEIDSAISTSMKIKNKPHIIIANTIKGKGVSFIEDQPAWHHKIPVGDEIISAIKELE